MGQEAPRNDAQFGQIANHFILNVESIICGVA